MTPHLLTAPQRNWQCPSCGLQHVTRETRPHTPMHPCPKLAGLAAPFVQVHRGQDLAKGSVVHRVVERGDWVGKERGIPIAGGKAVMALHTERADGHDTHVFAPTAIAERR